MKSKSMKAHLRNQILLYLVILCSCGTQTNPQKSHPTFAADPPFSHVDCDIDHYGAIREVHLVSRALVVLAKPTYPQEAVKKRIEGQVFVKILVDPSGAVIRACGDGNPILSRAAERAALACKFKKNFGWPDAQKGFRVDSLAYLFTFQSPTSEEVKHFIVIRP